MYIYIPLCRYWIALYRYVLVFIVPHVDIKLEDNKQFISNIPRIRLEVLLATLFISVSNRYQKKTIYLLFATGYKGYKNVFQ